MDPEVDVSSRFVHTDALHDSDGWYVVPGANDGCLMDHMLRHGVKCHICFFFWFASLFSVLSGLCEVNLLVVKASVF